MAEPLPEASAGQGQATPDAERTARLELLGLSLAKKRSDAIAAREASGIEQSWQEDLEYFQGIDDLNRNEHSNAWRTKPPGAYQVQAQNPTRSTVFTNITLPYVTAAAARIADMLLPSDDRNFALRGTPIPDLVALASGKVPAHVQATASQAQDQEAVQGMVQKAADQASQMVAAAADKALKAQTRIDDWLVECQFHAEVRRMIFDSALLGTGILKGPVPVKRKNIAIENGNVIIKVELEPGSRRIDPWDFYPDGACGENIHHGQHTWERDRLTPRKLSELKGTPGYIDSEINACLEEGPTKAIATTKQDATQTTSKAEEDKRFEVWYFHGFIDKQDMEAAGCQCAGGSNPHIPALMTMVNNRVIRASLNPLDTGEFPYDVMPWARLAGMPWGQGIARLGRPSQRIVLAAVRNMMDNGGISAGPQIVMKQGSIVPADGQWSITPRKVWYLGPDADFDDVRKAMTFFEIPSRQSELMAIVQFGLKMMEDATGLPMLLQGQLGKAPDTVGGMTLLNNNANAVLRQLARNFDEAITEPHIRRYYAWLMQYGEDEEKGDFEIEARGSSALVERDIQAQEVGHMANIASNPIFGIDPKKWATEWLRYRKFDPSKFQFDDQKWQEIVTNMASQKANVPLQIAQLKEEGQTERQKIQIQADTQESEKQREVRILLGKINERIASIKATGASEDTIQSIKADLAQLAMKLSTEKEISAATLATQIHTTHAKIHAPKPEQKSPKAVLKPPVEPAGRAPKGQSFGR